CLQIHNHHTVNLVNNAGQDVMLLLPTDWVILDGRGSVDDHGIVRYEWTLLQGDPSVDLKSPQPGMLKLTNLREGVYVVQLSVTDTVGQKSSDNITVTVVPQKHQTTDCTGICTRYQFICDDGCCIDIILACDGTAQCSDESDEAFCQSCKYIIVHYLFSFVGAVLPLALGLAITALLLLMVGCRLRLVRQKLKKVRPISSEESDYLINGMYL
uniref:PKD domain-containing protein n=1 Tax=Callorhinchus milii TaxID=7868 RepID=A0A4W3HIH7_CALMI